MVQAHIHTGTTSTERNPKAKFHSDTQLANSCHFRTQEYQPISPIDLYILLIPHVARLYPVFIKE